MSDDWFLVIVDELRLEFFWIWIDYFNYGKVVFIMKVDFDLGNLIDIEWLVGCGKNVFFWDELMGYGGLMLIEFFVFCWLEFFYGVKIEDVEYLFYDEFDVKWIIFEVICYN